MFGNIPTLFTKGVQLIKSHLPRWTVFIFVFTVIILLWGSLAAAAPPQMDVETTQPEQLPGMIEPENASFRIISGAVVIVAIVITGTILWGHSRS